MSIFFCDVSRVRGSETLTFANVEVYRYPGEWDTAGHAWPVSTTIEDVEACPAVTPMLDSDRCHHDTEIHGDANADVLNGYDVLPQKGFDEGAALTVNDASVVRVPNKQDNRSKAARHGAKTPMTSDAQGMYYIRPCWDQVFNRGSR